MSLTATTTTTIEAPNINAFVRIPHSKHIRMDTAFCGFVAKDLGRALSPEPERAYEEILDYLHKVTLGGGGKECGRKDEAFCLACKVRYYSTDRRILGDYHSNSRALVGQHIALLCAHRGDVSRVQVVKDALNHATRVVELDEEEYDDGHGPGQKRKRLPSAEEMQAFQRVLDWMYGGSEHHHNRNGFDQDRRRGF